MRSTYTNKDKKLLSDLGLQIRHFRSQAGLSQEKLAFKCDLDRTYIGSVERGERNISIINLAKIAEALEIKLHELLNLTDE